MRVSEVGVDQSEGRKVYEPSHPDAGPDGYVKYPNVDLAMEYVNMLEASRAYEANVTMMDVSKAMINALNDGADALVATDSNAVGAALLALQTRQQIATMALSMAHGQDSTALRLFGL